MSQDLLTLNQKITALEKKINYLLSLTQTQTSTSPAATESRLENLELWTSAMKSTGYTLENITTNYELLNQNLFLNTLLSNITSSLAEFEGYTLPLGTFSLTVAKLTQMISLNNTLNLTILDTSFLWKDSEFIGLEIQFSPNSPQVLIGSIAIDITLSSSIYTFSYGDTILGIMPPLKLNVATITRTNLYAIYSVQENVTKLYQVYINQETVMPELRGIGEFTFGIDVASGDPSLNFISSYNTDGDLELQDFYFKKEILNIRKYVNNERDTLVSTETEHKLQAANSVLGSMALSQIGQLITKVPLAEETTYVIEPRTIAITKINSVKVSATGMSAKQRQDYINLFTGLRLYDYFTAHSSGNTPGIGLYGNTSGVTFQDFSVLCSSNADKYCKYDSSTGQMVMDFSIDSDVKIPVTAIREGGTKTNLTCYLELELQNATAGQTHSSLRTGLLNTTYQWGYRAIIPVNVASNSYDTLTYIDEGGAPMVISGSTTARTAFNYNVIGTPKLTFTLINPYITQSESFSIATNLTLIIGDQTFTVTSLDFEYSDIVLNNQTTQGYVAVVSFNTSVTYTMTERFDTACTLGKAKNFEMVTSTATNMTTDESTNPYTAILNDGQTVQITRNNFYVPSRFMSSSYPMNASARFTTTHRNLGTVIGNYRMKLTSNQNYERAVVQLPPNPSPGELVINTSYSTVVFSSNFLISGAGVPLADFQYMLGLARPTTASGGYGANVVSRTNYYSGTVVRVYGEWSEVNFITNDDFPTILNNYLKEFVTGTDLTKLSIVKNVGLIRYRRPLSNTEYLIRERWTYNQLPSSISTNSSCVIPAMTSPSVTSVWLPEGLTNMANISQYLTSLTTLYEGLRQFQVDITQRVIEIEERLTYVEESITILANTLKQFETVLLALVESNSGNVFAQIVTFVGSSLANFLPLVGTVVTILGGVLEGIGQIADGDWSTGMLSFISATIMTGYVGHKFLQRVEKKLFSYDLSTVKDWGVSASTQKDLLTVHGTKKVSGVDSTSGIKVTEPQTSSHYVRFADDNGDTISLDLNDVVPMSVGMSSVRRNYNAVLLEFLSDLEATHPLLPSEISFKNQLLVDLSQNTTRRGRATMGAATWSVELVGLFDDGLKSLTSDMEYIKQITKIEKFTQFTLMLLYTGICGTEITNIIPVDQVYQLSQSFSTKANMSIGTQSSKFAPFMHNDDNVPFQNTTSKLNDYDRIFYKISQSDPDYLEGLIQE